MQDKIAQIILDSCSDYTVLGKVAPQMWYRRAAVAVAKLCKDQLAKQKALHVRQHELDISRMADVQGELAASEAKLAVMAEALDWLFDWVEDVSTYLPFMSEEREPALVKIEAALSAAPKVKWVGKGKAEEAGGGVSIRFEGKVHKNRATGRLEIFEIARRQIPNGQQVTVYVLADDKPQKDEEEQTSIVQAFKELREIVGDSFDGIDDVGAWVRRVRSGKSGQEPTDAQGQ